MNVYADSQYIQNKLHQIIAAIIFRQDDVSFYCKEKDDFNSDLVLEN